MQSFPDPMSNAGFMTDSASGCSGYPSNADAGRLDSVNEVVLRTTLDRIHRYCDESALQSIDDSARREAQSLQLIARSDKLIQELRTVLCNDSCR